MNRSLSQYWMGLSKGRGEFIHMVSGFAFQFQCLCHLISLNTIFSNTFVVSNPLILLLMIKKQQQEQEQKNFCVKSSFE